MEIHSTKHNEPFLSLIFFILETYDGFDTRVLELKTVFNMTGNLGRKRRVSVLSVTGNKNGLAGFAIGKGLEPKTAMRKSKNRAGQKLMNIKIFNNHTGMTCL